jgi:cyclophilin family peptidyl-prolyl cis-trans isomerase
LYRYIESVFHFFPTETLESFKAAKPPYLISGEKGIGLRGKPLHYKGSKFHRIIPKFMVQGEADPPSLRFHGVYFPQAETLPTAMVLVESLFMA